MRGGFNRVAIGVLILLLAALVAQPYLDRYFFAATEPRAVLARGAL